MKGRMFGQYRVTGVLGEGGMGIVYSAEHTLLDRPAAIKVLQPKLSDEQEIVDRFKNEARAAAKIRHPGIVEIYEIGTTDDQDRAVYIVMELLEGETLRARRKRGPLRWSTALALTRQIAGALAAAHAKGIVHRDLKPDNIFLVPDADIPGGERIKLLDFGIARLTSPPPGQHKTRTGMVMGTPTYMAPEQCRGIPVDARADLYSVGCILFELCTGRPPFVGEGEGDVLVDHIQKPPPTMATLASGIPKEVESLVQRLLAKSPADRVQSADELIRLINAARTASGQTGMSGQSPVLAGPPVATDDDERGDESDRDVPTSADREEPRGAPVEPTLEVRSSARRSRRDAITPMPLAQTADALANTAMPSSPRLRTTLSSAARELPPDPPDEPPATSRRWKLIGGIGGAAAALGMLAIVFATVLSGNSADSLQAAAAPPSSTAPAAAVEPEPPAATVSPSPVEVVPNPPAAAPSEPPLSKEAPSQPPAAAQPETAASAALISPKLSAADKPATRSPAADEPPTKSPLKSKAQAGGALPPPSSGSTASTKGSGPQPAEVTVRIESNPPGAQITSSAFFDHTPMYVKFARENKEIKVKLELRGYKDEEFVIRPNKDVIKVVQLKPSPQSQPSASSSSAKAPSLPASTSPAASSTSASANTSQSASQPNSAVASQPQSASPPPTSQTPPQPASPAAPPTRP